MPQFRTVTRGNWICPKYLWGDCVVVIAAMVANTCPLFGGEQPKAASPKSAASFSIEENRRAYVA